MSTVSSMAIRHPSKCKRYKAPIARAKMSRSDLMRRVGRTNTGAEKTLANELRRRKIRFHQDERIEGLEADFALAGYRVAVFVDGCFWHGCPRHATFPKSNRTYWIPKLAENKRRDKRQTAKLKRRGWRVLRVWEHDCMPLNDRVVERILKARDAERARR